MPGRSQPPTGASHEDIVRRLDRGADEFNEIRADLALITEQLKVLPQMQDTIRCLTAKVDETKDVVDAWAALKTAGRVGDWFGRQVIGLGKVLVAIGLLYGAFRIGLLHLLGLQSH